jgi:hypothetical protein
MYDGMKKHRNDYSPLGIHCRVPVPTVLVIPSAAVGPSTCVRVPATTLSLAVVDAMCVVVACIKKYRIKDGIGRESDRNGVL